MKEKALWYFVYYGKPTVLFLIDSIVPVFPGRVSSLI